MAGLIVILLCACKLAFLTSSTCVKIIEFSLKNEARKAYLHVHKRIIIMPAIFERGLCDSLVVCMTRHRKCGTIRKCLVVSRPLFFATKMAASTRGWTDRTTSALLEALKTRESLWNTKCESCKNRNTKKKHYGEIVVILKEDCAHSRTHHLLLRFLRFFPPR